MFHEIYVTRSLYTINQEFNGENAFASATSPPPPQKKRKIFIFYFILCFVNSNLKTNFFRYKKYISRKSILT